MKHIALSALLVVVSTLSACGGKSSSNKPGTGRSVEPVRPAPTTPPAPAVVTLPGSIKLLYGNNSFSFVTSPRETERSVYYNFAGLRVERLEYWFSFANAACFGNAQTTARLVDFSSGSEVVIRVVKEDEVFEKPKSPNVLLKLTLSNMDYCQRYVSTFVIEGTN